jgi:hypothetical protein
MVLEWSVLQTNKSEASEFYHGFTNAVTSNNHEYTRISGFANNSHVFLYILTQARLCK